MYTLKLKISIAFLISTTIAAQNVASANDLYLDCQDKTTGTKLSLNVYSGETDEQSGVLRWEEKEGQYKGHGCGDQPLSNEKGKIYGNYTDCEFLPTRINLESNFVTHGVFAGDYYPMTKKPTVKIQINRENGEFIYKTKEMNATEWAEDFSGTCTKGSKKKANTIF